jgi:hypothetical protein
VKSNEAVDYMYTEPPTLDYIDMFYKTEFWQGNLKE